MNESIAVEAASGSEARRHGWDPVDDWCEVERSEVDPQADAGLGPSPLADAIAALEGLEGELARMHERLEAKTDRNEE